MPNPTNDWDALTAIERDIEHEKYMEFYMFDVITRTNRTCQVLYIFHVRCRVLLLLERRLTLSVKYHIKA